MCLEQGKDGAETSRAFVIYLGLHLKAMPRYLALAQRLFTSDANVRNVKAFFSTRRAKFEPRVLLGP